MTVYRYLIYDASDGQLIAELPLTGVTFSRVLSGVGSLAGSLSIWHPSCTRSVLGFDTADSDREITVVRDDVPIWNGPVTGIDGTMSAGAMQITAREASFYLQKRTLEINKNYDGTDIFDAVRDLITYMTTKVANGSDGMSAGADIVASLPRWSVDPGPGTLAGSTISDPSPPTFYGSARHLISDCMEGLAADPTTGFEWRMDYETASSRGNVARTVTLGYPNLGSVLTTQLSEAVVADWGRTGDWERGATRVHALYANGVKTLQSASAVSDGILLTEAVDDISDVTKSGVATSYATNLRRLARPPVRSYQAAFTPSDNGLQYDFANLGDTVPLAFTSPDILAISDSRRVIQIDVTPSSGDVPETVALTFNIRLDDLST